MAKKKKTITRTGKCSLCGCVDPEYGLELASKDNMRGEQWKCFDDVSCEIRRSPHATDPRPRHDGLRPKREKKPGSKAATDREFARVDYKAAKGDKPTISAEMAFLEKWRPQLNHDASWDEFERDMDQLIAHVEWRNRP